MHACGDVWALGCLQCELLTEQIVNYHPDWIGFFFRLTHSKEVHPFIMRGCFQWMHSLL